MKQLRNIVAKLMNVRKKVEYNFEQKIQFELQQISCLIIDRNT